MSGGLGGCDLSTSVASMKLSEEPRLIDTFTEDISRELSGAFADVKVMALDLEGVDLSRAGRISIVQVSTPARCFLIDVLGKGPDDLVVSWLRSLLQSENILKVIHDSRMDSDALFNLLKIELVNVHDTSCWQAVIGLPNTSLNDILDSTCFLGYSPSYHDRACPGAVSTISYSRCPQGLWPNLSRRWRAWRSKARSCFSRASRTGTSTAGFHSV